MCTSLFGLSNVKNSSDKKLSDKASYVSFDTFLHINYPYLTN